MKKLFALLLAVLMVCGLCACGGGETAKVPEEEAAKPTPAELIQALKDSDAELGEREYGMKVGNVIEMKEDDVNFHIISIVDVEEPEFECGTIVMTDEIEMIMIDSGTLAGPLDVQRLTLVLLKELGISEDNLLRMENEVLVYGGEGHGLGADGYYVYAQQYKNDEEEDTRRILALLVVIKPEESMTDYVEGELKVFNS